MSPTKFRAFIAKLTEELGVARALNFDPCRRAVQASTAVLADL